MMVGRTLYILLFVVLACITAEYVIPNATLTQFTPQGGQIGVPPDQNLTIKLELRDDLNQHIFVDEANILFDQLDCISDDEYILDKWADDEGNFFCNYEDIPWNRTIINVKYGNEIFQTYSVGYLHNVVNTTASSLTPMGTYFYADDIFSAILAPRDGNYKELRANKAFEIYNNLQIESTLPLIEKNMLGMYSILIKTKAPTTSGNHSINFFYYENNVKTYVYKGFIKTLSSQTIDLTKSTLTVPTGWYRHTQPTKNNVIKIDVAKDIYGNIMDIPPRSFTIKIYRHNIIWSGTHVWESTLPLHANSQNEIIVPASTINTPFIGICDIHISTSPYGVQTHKQFIYKYVFA